MTNTTVEDPRDAVAIDFESFYDTKRGIGIKEMGVWNYLRHPEQDIYLVSAYGYHGGVQYVGRPEGFDWNHLRDKTVLAHNFAFDGQCALRLKEIGVIPEDLIFKDWNCTANMAAFMGVPRSLRDASEFLLGKKVSKAMRDYMNGKRWEDAVKDGKAEELLEYGKQDAFNCWDLWAQCSQRWPKEEKELSKLTIEMCWNGMDVDRARVQVYIQRLERIMRVALRYIPWVEQGKAPTSGVAAREEALLAGVTPPSSWSMNSEECTEWFNEHANHLKWAKAVRLYRRCNMLKTKFETLYAQTSPEGRLILQIKYGGAHTLRWSGGSGDEDREGGGFNPQNLPVGVMFGTNLRRSFRPANGKKFIICDQAQIEARLLLYFVKDSEQLSMVGNGISVYEAHARKSMGWIGGVLKKENPQLYKLAKARRLALGYGCAWEKFIWMATVQYGCGFVFEKEVSEEDTIEFRNYVATFGTDAQKIKIRKANPKYMRAAVNSWLIVTDFRKKEPGIPKLWKTLDDSFRRSHGEDFRLVLPSGRVMVYRDVIVGARSATAVVCKNEKFVREKFYGGKLVENLVQGTARDSFGFSKLQLREAGYPINLSAHDEVALEVQKDVPVSEIERIMSIRPPWLNCPIGAEGFECDYYRKEKPQSKT